MAGKNTKNNKAKAVNAKKNTDSPKQKNETRLNPMTPTTGRSNQTQPENYNTQTNTTKSTEKSRNRTKQPRQ